MRTPLSRALAALALTALLAGPAAVAAQEAPGAQTVSVQDRRSGDGPCGFPVERAIEGTVAVVPSIDAAGNLVLAIEPVALRGVLTNPANGKSVELRWVEPSGPVAFGHDGRATTVAWLLNGRFFRGYDDARSDLALALPADGAEAVAFVAGERAEEPWAHACALLA